MRKRLISAVVIAVGLLTAILIVSHGMKEKAEVISISNEPIEKTSAAKELIPEVNCIDIVDFARHMAAVKMTTPEGIFGVDMIMTEEIIEALHEHSLVDLPTQGRTSFATITSCKINEADNSKVNVYFTSEGIPRSDDDQFYLFELETFETEHGEDYIAQLYKWDENFYFSFDLNLNSPSSALFSKFVVAIKVDGQYIDISRGHYITNPEAVAQYTYDFPTPASKKGLIVDPAKLGGSELTDLGVKQAAYNIPIGYILGETSNGNWPTIHYKYNGKTYSFNGQRIAEFDIVFGALTKKGIVTTAVLLNDKNSNYMQLIHPEARGGSAPYYMFNASEESGTEYLEAVATFLAKRYSGKEHGKIANWVIGNEVNARSAWNYMNYTSVENYAQAYAQAFRIFYNGIKSVNANARVYMCIDQLWNRNLSSTDSYDAKDFLDAFNNTIFARGNIDWGLADHPYPVPLTWPKFWAMPSNYARMNLVRNSVDTPYITIQNIHVLTDYMQRSEFLTPDGEVRSIILNEIGFGSDHGETLQAACYAYGYYIADANQHIDAFILNKQSDMGVEIAQGLSLGLDRTDGSHKAIYSVFRAIDTPSGYDATAFAKDIIGISSWDEVITKR